MSQLKRKILCVIINPGDGNIKIEIICFLCFFSSSPTPKQSVVRSVGTAVTSAPTHGKRMISSLFALLHTDL